MRSTHFFRRNPIQRALKSGCGLLIAGNLLSSPVFAQTENVVLEELIVTARRTEESIMKVPVAVTALDAGNLQEKSITQFADLRTQIPSLGISTVAGSSTTPLVSLRGQRTSETILTLDAAVPMYFADVLINPTFGANMAMYDLANVQVLKGPQGTLFGRNSTGGAVLLSPQRPSNNFGGYAQFEIGDYHKYGVEFGVDLPASENMVFRIAGRKVERNGYQDNLFTGEQEVFGDENNEALRVSMLAYPTETLENLLIIDWAESKEKPQVLAPNALSTASSSSPLITNGVFLGGPTYADLQAAIDAQNARDWTQVSSDITDNYENARNIMVANTTVWEINDSMSLKNILGYRKFEWEALIDADGSSYSLFGNTPELEGGQNVEAEQYSNELQLFGDALDGNLDWLVAGYYYLQHGSQNNHNQVTPNLIQNSPAGDIENTAYAIFGESTYRFTDEFSLTLGLRRSWDQREVVAKSEQSGIFSPGVQGCAVRDEDGNLLPNDACARTDDDSFAANTYRIIGTYEPSYDQMMYISVGTGYRTGGFNLRGKNNAELEPFDEETVTNLEFGHKANWELGSFGALRTALAVYQQDYQDIQKTQAGENGATVIINAAEATIRGGELEVTYLPTNNLEFALALAVVDASYDEWDYDDPNSGTIIDYSDAPFSWIPEYSGTASVRYTLPLDPNIGDVSLFANYYYQDETINAIERYDHPAIGGLTEEEYENSITQEAYGILDLRADWKYILGSDFDVALWIKNVEDKDYKVGGLDVLASLGWAAHNYGPPRTWGASVRYHF